MVTTTAAESSPDRGRTWFALLAVAPLLAVLAGTLVVVGGWLLGASPFWPDPGVSLAEAAATRDAGEVVRLVEQEGADPNQDYPMRAGMLDAPQARAISPLLAAVEAKRLEIVQVLVRLGAVVPQGEQGRALVCRAVETGAPEIAAYLESAGPVEVAPGDCEEIAR